MTTYIFGEAMLEYHSRGGKGLRFGGDTLNTAIHLSRAGHEVAYVTAIGTDPVSDALAAAWRAEGIDTRYVLRHPDRNPGIYAIYLDGFGERSFLYWRENSAARAMFELPGIGEVLKAAEEGELLYFSLISLAIIDGAGGNALIELAKRRKSAGKAVAYDSNFRPLLWDDLANARNASSLAMANCTLGLPTNSDECALWNTNEGEGSIIERWLDAGCELVAVKAAERGCFAARAKEPLAREYVATSTKVVDSSGAGDAFNGGFLGAWLNGNDLDECIRAGQQLACKTLQHRGAIWMPTLT